MQQSQPVTAAVNPISTPASAGSPSEEAPPKQVALAMDRLGQAARIIADIRIGADRLLEALFIASQPHQSTKPLHLFQKEDDAMRRHLQDLRSLGRQLEESGVLNESLRSRSNSWGLHMPLVCPDGAVVAYAWKRQLAGQAGASAVDRTRLALKAFTDQKRRFFPHLDDGLFNNETPSKKHCGSEEIMLDCKDEVSNLSTLPDVLKRLEKEVPNLGILTFERLDWLKRASSLSSSQNENSLEHNFHGSNNLRPGSFGAGASDKIAVIELVFPSVFRVVVSLHPAGSIDPDAVAFFSPDEGGSYVHARGYSVHHVYRHITEYAATALQYFIGNQAETSLYCLLHWICSYQTLFTRSCRNVTTSVCNIGKPSATVDLKLQGASLDSLECSFACVRDVIPPLPCIQKVVVVAYWVEFEDLNRCVVGKEAYHCLSRSVHFLGFSSANNNVCM